MTKDWTGNKKTTFVTLGASNHSTTERADRDYYATDPKVIKGLLENEKFGTVWENACGGGHLSKELINSGFKVFSSDIIKRDFECKELDFMQYEKTNLDLDIITNLPYNIAQEFIEKSLNVVNVGRKIAMFLKLTFLEGQKRRKFFEKYPPKKVCVYSARVQVARNGDSKMFKKSSAACYAWFIWEKGFKGDPIIKWI